MNEVEIDEQEPTEEWISDEPHGMEVGVKLIKRAMGEIVLREVDGQGKIFDEICLDLEERDRLKRRL